MRSYAPGWQTMLTRAMLLIEQQNIPKESVIFVLSLVKAARRALLSATGYRVD